MRISSPGINPNQFYWQEKDTKAATDNIKLHSELKGNPVNLITEYFNFAIEKIKSFVTKIKLPNYENLHNFVLNTTEKILMSRLGYNPSSQEIGKMLEGERLEIAKVVAIRIGKTLDKALYAKFKSKQRQDY